MFPAGGWIVTRALEEGSSIYETTDPEWIIKRLTYNTESTDETCEELEASLIVFNNRRRLRNCVAFPRSLREFCGIEPDGYAWIAMRRYDGSLSIIPGRPVAPVIWQRHWKRIAVHILNFLEDYHTHCRRIHMDIKASNILMDRARCQFVVTDFGLSAAPSRVPLSEYSADYLWYYLEHGADPEKPIAAWRFDLVALGFMLARLTWNPDMSERFVEAARAMRRGDNSSYSPAGFVALRSMEMDRALNPLLRTYFVMVESTVGWYDTEPPHRTFYRSLAALFE